MYSSKSHLSILVTSHCTAPCRTLLYCRMSHPPVLPYVTFYYTVFMSHPAVLSQVTSFYISHVTLYCLLSHAAVLPNVTAACTSLCHILLYCLHVTPCCTVPRHILQYYPMSHPTVSLHVTSCCDKPCYTPVVCPMLHPAVPCRHLLYSHWSHHSVLS